MNNKETLQSHNTRLSNNNTDLTSVLNKVNSLPARPTIEDKILENNLSGEYANNRIKKLGDYRFRNNTYITKFSSTSITSIGVSAFDGCKSLKECNTPNVTSIGGSTFSDSGLIKAHFPNVKNVAFGSIFSNCASLEYVDFGSVLGFSSGSFSNCKLLTAIVIRNTSVCTLKYSTSFNGTPIEEGTGYIYVWKSLLEEYRSATNWSAYNPEQFRAIEDYPEICGEVE